MKSDNRVVWLTGLIIVLVLIAAGIGLFWQDGGSPFDFTTLRGETVQIYGQGIYRYDTVLTAIGFRAADAVTLVVGIPVLLVSLWQYRRGSLRGGFMLGGALVYILYNYSSLAFGAAYNNLFLVYLAVLTASLFGFILTFTAFDAPSLPSRFSTRLPRRGIGIYLIVAGTILILIWLVLSILPALFAGQTPPEVWSYTTIVTFVVDMALVAPCLIVAGILLLRQAPIGYLSASILVIFIVILGINLLAGGITQMVVGLIGMGQFIGFVVSFAILTLFAAGFSFALWRSVND
jgi:hypothetical protein